MTTTADLLTAAGREVGVEEDPLGSNTGPRVRQYQASTPLEGTGWPWCAAFITWLLRLLGLDVSWCSPATKIMWDRARERGYAITNPVEGCLIIWPGVHVGLVTAVHANGTVSTIEGNSGDMVARRTRLIAGAKFILPPGLTPATLARLYWLEDRVARRNLRFAGPWRTLAAAKKRYAELSPARQRRARIKRMGDGRWVMELGLPPDRGPWFDQAKRARDKVKLEASLGRKLRPYSTPVKNQPVKPAAAGPATGLGKTT